MSRRPPPVRADDMWADACALLERAERLQRTFFVPVRPGDAPPAWEPPVDVYETAAAVHVVVALPGVARDQLEIRLRGNTLVVAGIRPLPTGLRRAVVHRMELPHGRFERRIVLATPGLALGEASFADGCLELTLEKRS